MLERSTEKFSVLLIVFPYLFCTSHFFCCMQAVSVPAKQTVFLMCYTAMPAFSLLSPLPRLYITFTISLQNIHSTFNFIKYYFHWKRMYFFSLSIKDAEEHMPIRHNVSTK